MPKQHEQDSFHGSAVGRWQGGGTDKLFEGAGMLHPREVYVDFGLPKAPSPLTVAATLAYDDSAFVSWSSIVAQMAPGEVRSISVTFTNTGTTTWAAGTYRLLTVNPDNNTTFGSINVVVAAPVAPTASYTFTFNITAPLVAGNYTFQVRISRDGSGSFGQAASVINITVAAGPPITDDADYVSNTIPTTMTVGGAAVTFNVVMLNSGATTWTTAAGYRLVPVSSSFPGLAAAYIGTPASVAPAANMTFSIQANVPIAAGTYTMSFRMQNGTGVQFGDQVPIVSISVAVAGSCQTLPAPFIGNATTGPYTLSYRIVWRNAANALIGVTGEASAVGILEPALSPGDVSVAAAKPAGAIYMELYRTYSTVPTGPAASLGRIHALGVSGFPIGAVLSRDDSGQAPDVVGSAPTCSIPEPLPPGAPLASTALSDILSNQLPDGSTGGEIINGELVYDFTNNPNPFNWDLWPTADWARTVIIRNIGIAFLQMRIIGINGWGREIGVSASIPPSGTYGNTHIFRGFWKIKKIIISNPNALSRFAVGWGGGLSMKYPYKVNYDPAGGALSDAGTESGYLTHVWVNAEDWTGGNHHVYAFPSVCNDPIGIMYFENPPDGVTHNECCFIADNLTEYQSAVYKAAVAANNPLVAVVIE